MHANTEKGTISGSRLVALPVAIFAAIFYCVTASATDDYFSLTWDNDLFIGNDSGYTNGLFLSWIAIADDEHGQLLPILVKPLAWSIDLAETRQSLTTHTFGQTMVTPENIIATEPDENDLPYSGLLFFKSSFLSIASNRADNIETTIGVVGPASGAERTQEFIHRITGSDEPMGWDAQLENEIVFQFTRGRLWRSWVARNKRFDLLLSSQASIGTLSSMLAAGVTFRYGVGLGDSYAMHLLNNSRISNPVSLKGSWQFFTGINAGYLFNQIFTDGNTFKDSPSIDYDHERIGVSFGYSCSWKTLSLAFVLNDTNVTARTSEKALEDFTQFGSLTVAWRY